MIYFLEAPSAQTPSLTPMPARHLCTPRQDHGVVVSGHSEDPDQANGHGPYSFALGPNPTVQRDWHLQALNGMWGGERERLWPRRGVGGWYLEMRCPSISGVGPGLGGAAPRGPVQAHVCALLCSQQVPMPTSPWPCIGWSHVNT